MQQATHAHSGATTGTSPANITNVSPSRRALLGFAGIGALALAAPLTAKLPASDRWDTFRLRWERASEAAANFHEFTYAPARERLEAFTGKSPPLHFDVTASNGQSVRHHVNSYTRSPFYVPHWNKQHDELADAWDAWMERAAEGEARDGWQSISEKMDDLWSQEDRARKAMINEPAPHAKALALKVQLALPRKVRQRSNSQFRRRGDLAADDRDAR